MAYNPTQVPSSGIWNAVKGVMDLFKGLNKSEGPSSQGANPTPENIFTSDIPDEKLVELKRQWDKDYATYYESIEKSQELAMEYWLGKQADDDGSPVAGQDFVLNKIFKSVETFIPIATRANPDPVVTSDPGPVEETLAHAVKSALVYEADRLKLRKILKRGLRQWLIYRLGLIKVGFDPVTNRITTESLNPKRWKGDKDGHWDESGFFTGTWQCEVKKGRADKLAEMFPDKAESIKEKAGGKKGTKLEYSEYWYMNRDVFYTLDDVILGKFKNPHWNYDVEEKEPVTDPETGEIVLEGQKGQKGQNLLDEPKAPFIGLSIFSTGLAPHDETSLILQNIPLQDKVNRRARQIDRNVDSMNNGIAVSNVFTDDQASKAAAARRKGQAIRIPANTVEGHVKTLEAPPIPNQVFEDLTKSEQELEDIFGVSGSSPQGIDKENTARGKILVNQLDSSRIGGGITEYVEQVADTCYNYWVQLMLVHFTEPQYYISAGQQDGDTLISIKNTDFALVKRLSITVKEGSLIPKDPLTQRNEAIDLWSANAIDPVNFYKRLDMPDPAGMAQSLILWQMVQKGQLPPEAYLPSFKLPVQAQLPQQGVGGPAVNQIGKPQQPQAPTPGSQTAVQEQGKQLLESVPVR